MDAARQTRPFFVTEYIAGALDGEQWLVEQGILDVPTGIAVGLQVAKGLAVAHQKGVCHLDLKPANLLFKPTAAGLMVKIIDFGLARVATPLKPGALSHPSKNLTLFGQGVVGTLFYAPPEQLGETKYGQPGAKSDLFAFAATLYRLMTGESPQNLNPLRLAEAPPELFYLLCQCKEENPARRPDSAEQVVARLAEIEHNGYEYNGYAKSADIAEREADAQRVKKEAQRQKDEAEQRNKAEQEVQRQKDEAEQRNKAEQEALRKKQQADRAKRQAELERNRQTDIPKRDSVRRQRQEKRSAFFPMMAVLVVIVLVIGIGFHLSEKNEVETDAIPSRDSIRSEEESGKVFRDRLKDGSQGPEMVWIPAGSFRMGDIQGGGYDNEKPVHEVSVKRFAMGRSEVTFAEYDLFAEATGREKLDDEGWGRGNRPVINVSWDDATAYAEWLSQQTGHPYRLPTEAEWEYSARAGTETKYWWGNDIGSNKANCSNSYCGDRFEYTAPVGSFAANPWGLYDTVGNVWEWTCSEYDAPYAGKETRCIEQKSGGLRARRGGAWDNEPRSVRAADRDRGARDDRNDDVGFRLARLF